MPLARESSEETCSLFRPHVAQCHKLQYKQTGPLLTGSKQTKPHHFTKTQDINLHAVSGYNIAYCYACGTTKATSPMNTPHYTIVSN